LITLLAILYGFNPVSVDNLYRWNHFHGGILYYF
jgi:hypothetical protein